MLKLLFMIIALLLLSLAVLGLRHHRQEVTSQTAKIHALILQREQSLADQKVLITRATNPLTLAINLKAAGMNAGEAMQPRDVRRTRVAPGAPAPGTVETDLVAPLRRH